MRYALGLGVALAALAVPSVAAAQFRSGAYVDELGPLDSADSSGESPQNFAFELRFGDYLPNVDDEFGGGPGPFQETFGNDFKFYVGGEFDWQALRIPKLGTFGPGIGLGYTRSKGKALVPGSTEKSSQGTALRILPLYAVAVLRVDVFARDTPVPLVPYVKGGVGYALWWVKSGGRGAKAEGADGNVAGKDTSWGYQFALGGMLLLDALDPEAAREMDANTGVNNAYFFAEWYFADLDGFGSGGQMQVGTSTWMLGLALEM